MNDDYPGGSYRTEPIGHLDGHLRWMRRQGAVDSTLKTRRAVLTRLAEWLGHDPATATVDELEEWQDTLAEVSANNLRYKTQVVRPYYRWLHARGHRDDDPALMLATAPRPSRLPRPIGESDLMTVLRTARPRIQPWLILAAWCGLRSKEIAELDRSDFFVDDAGQPWLRIVGKNGRQRDVPLTDWVWRRLHPLLPEAGPCWTRERGGGPVTAQHVSQYCSQHIRSCGVPAGITMHSLRHRAATQLLAATGGDVRLVQQYLGHATLATVMIYTRVTPASLASAVDALPAPAEELPAGMPAPRGGRVATGVRRSARLTRAELDVHLTEWLSGYTSASTREAFGLDTRQWLAWCSDNRVDPLAARRVHVNLYRQHMQARVGRPRRPRYAPASVRRKLDSLSSWFRHLADADVVDTNPALGATRPRRDVTTRVGLDLDEAGRLLAAADQAGELEAAVVWMLTSTGMRIGELLRLDEQHVEREHGKTVLKVTRKGGRVDRVVLPVEANARLQAWMAVRPRTLTGCLFTRRAGRLTDTQARTLVRGVAEAAGIEADVTPHVLRHTAATLALMQPGVGLREAKELLGHASLTHVLRYDHARAQLQESAAATLAVALAVAATEAGDLLPQ